MAKKNNKNNTEETIDEFHGVPLSDFLKERMAEKRIGIHHLEKSTGISKHLLEALVEGDFEALPAAPYVRGYLRHIAPLIGVDADELWEQYRKEAGLNISGARDQLPQNRFALSDRTPRRLIIVTAIIILLLVYAFINGRRLIGQPELTLFIPSSDTASTTEEVFVFRGAIDPDDTLTINDELVEVNNQGVFEKSLPLQPGRNTFAFEVKRFLGKELQVVRHIFYEPIAEEGDEEVEEIAPEVLF